MKHVNKRVSVAEPLFIEDEMLLILATGDVLCLSIVLPKPNYSHLCIVRTW